MPFAPLPAILPLSLERDVADMKGFGEHAFRAPARLFRVGAVGQHEMGREGGRIAGQGPDVEVVQVSHARRLP